MFVNKTALIMHIEAIKAVIERDLNDLQQIVNDIEVGHTISKIESHLLKTKVESLSDLLVKLFDSISDSIMDKPLTADLLISSKVESSKNETSTTQQSKSADIVLPLIDTSAEKPISPKLAISQNSTKESVEFELKAEAEVIKSFTDKEKAELSTTPGVSQKTQDHSAKVTIAEKFTEINRSLNDRIGESKALIDRASMLSRKPISDIHKAIKLNDRVGFLRELFNGDMQKYQQTIDQINQMHDFDEALNFIHQNFSWDQTSDTFKNFIEIVYRRFMN